MTFEGGFLLILAFLFGAPLLLVLARLVGWVTGTKTKPVWFTLLFLIALPIAFLFYLDIAGTVQPMRVTDKRENVTVHSSGQWQRNINITAEYNVPGEILPVQMSLGCDAAMFDQLQIGQTVEARLLDLGGVFKFARLRQRSAFTFLTERFPPPPAGPWQEGIATIEGVRHITESLGSRSEYHTPYRWPYDVVRLRFQPKENAQSLIAVDVVETASVPPLSVGQTIKITWPQDDPRAARIVNARPGAPWTNWVVAFGEDISVMLLLLFGLLAAAYIMNRRRKRKAQAIR
ncbi:MAG: hypothetical protein U0Y68_03370 [Blastocatellia bacterium]